MARSASAIRRRISREDFTSRIRIKDLASDSCGDGRQLGRLLGSYVFATIFAAIVLVGGLWCWINLVAPTAIWQAALLSQVILFLLLIPRFWQRGTASDVDVWR